MTRVRITEYTLSLLPEDSIDAHSFAITVEYRGQDKWAIKHAGYTLCIDGEWEYEPRPSSRDDDYLARCRFDLNTALPLAAKMLPTITVNGYTAGDVLAKREA